MNTPDDWWLKSQQAYQSGEWSVDHDDLHCAVNRFFFSSLQALTSLFTREGVAVDPRTEVTVALHRHYVCPERWPRSLLQEYRILRQLRYRADYEIECTPSLLDALQARAIARNIRTVVHNTYPHEFHLH